MDGPVESDGTRDWYTVFQDPDNGLLGMIDRCDRPDKLRACYRVAIDGLFSRSSDREIRDSYLHMIDELYENDPGEGQLMGIKTKIRMIFQRIMHERITRANTCANSNPIDEERREPGDDPVEALAALAPVA